MAIVDKPSILSYNYLTGAFSNAPEATMRSITDFTAYNDYIHHYGGATIPYLSTLTVANEFDPYPTPSTKPFLDSSAINPDITDGNQQSPYTQIV